MNGGAGWGIYDQSHVTIVARQGLPARKLRDRLRRPTIKYCPACVAGRLPADYGEITFIVNSAEVASPISGVPLR